MLRCLVIMKAVFTQTMIGIAMPLAALITTIKEIIEQASIKDNTSVTALKEAANSIIENHWSIDQEAIIMVNTVVQGLNSVSIRQALAKILASVAEVKVDLRLNREDNIVLDLVQARQDMDLLLTLRKIKGRDPGTIREVKDILQISRTRHTLLQEAHQTTMMESEMREAIH